MIEASKIIHLLPIPDLFCGGECFLAIGYSFEALGFLVHGVWHAVLVSAMWFFILYGIKLKLGGSDASARFWCSVIPSVAWGQAVEFSQGVRHFQHPSNFYGLIDSAEAIVVAVLTALLLEFFYRR